MRDGSAGQAHRDAARPERRAGRAGLAVLTAAAALAAAGLVFAQDNETDTDDAANAPQRIEVREFADTRPGVVRLERPEFIETPQILARADARAAQIQTLSPEAAERIRYNAAAYERLATTVQQVPTREIQVEQTAERPDGRALVFQEPRVDARGRELYAVDWEAVQRDWSVQLEDMSREEMIVSGQTVRRAPLRLSPIVRNMQPESLSEVSVPVLAPGFTGVRTRGFASDRAEDGMLMFSRGESYTASMHMDTVMINVSGSRVANIVEEDPRRARLMREMASARDLIITPIRGGQEILFNRYGVAYSVLILCENPQENAVCADPETGAAVARSLMLVGGAPRMGGGGQ